MYSKKLFLFFYLLFFATSIGLRTIGVSKKKKKFSDHNSSTETLSIWQVLNISNFQTIRQNHVAPALPNVASIKMVITVGPGTEFVINKE